MDIEIEYDDRELQRALNRLIDAGTNLSPAMREIAGHLADSVADSFDREQAPDGAPWKPLKPKTVRGRHRQGYAAGPILDQVAENHGSPRRSSRCALTCSRVRVRVGGRFP